MSSSKLVHSYCETAPLLSVVIVTGQQCSEEGAVRLADGVNVDGVRVNGRVEICINQQWGTVCDDDWDVAGARVACSQLGAFDCKCR